MSATPEFTPEDRRVAGLFLAALYRSAPSGSLIEVRFRTPAGMGRRFHDVRRLDRVVDTVLGLAARSDVYVGVLPRRRRGGGKADVIERGGVVWADCDTDDSVSALRAFRPLPAMVVGSSEGKRHAYWFLAEPAGVDLIESLNRRIALALGADSVCSDRTRILRPVGSLNWKRFPPAAVALLHLAADERVAVAELDRVLRREPVAAETVTRASRQPFATSDPLAAIPPRVYFERLTGQSVSRSGKTRCPFHQDRTPSLHVYEDPGRGWYCFGCGRGGSIYDLAGLLLRRGTRGAEFVALRRELEARMGLCR